MDTVYVCYPDDSSITTVKTTTLSLDCVFSILTITKRFMTSELIYHRDDVSVITVMPKRRKV